MRHSTASLLVILAGILGTAASLSAQSDRLEDLVANADDIIVGSLIDVVSVTPEQVDFQIRVARSIKGDRRVGETVRGSFFPHGRFDTAPLPFAPDAGIFFTKREEAGKQNRLLPPNNGIGYRRAYISLGDPLAPPLYTTSTIDNVAAEILQAIEKRSSDESYVAHLSMGIAQASIVKDTYKKWLSSSNANLRRLAMSGLIATGDVKAVTGLHQEIRLAPKATLVVRAASALGGLRSTDPVIVKAVGDLIADPAVPSGARLAAATALAEIHTKECLPYLYELLKDPDVNLREQAARGFSKFVLNVRVARPGEILPRR